MSSVFGQNIKVSVFGQSHSEAIGVTIDGLPAGIRISREKLQDFLDRRAPGKSRYTTKRKEPDKAEFLSGLVDGVTCGAPVTAIIKNTNQHSKDYDQLKDCPRPGHADYTAHIKYKGHEDLRGGGHFSGRLTAPLCIAGGICKQILEEKGIMIHAAITEIAGKRENITEELDKIIEEKDSAGGIISCMITGIPAGVGEPVFDGVENRIAQAVFGIPAVKGIEFGAGFEAARMKGSQNNDEFTIEDGKVVTKTNHCGGILGGITNGMPVAFNTAIKPTPSIGKEQNSISYCEHKDRTLVIEGRHDPCIVMRAVPCVEAAAAIAVYDLLLSAIMKGELE